MKKYYKDYKLVSRFRQNGKVVQAAEYNGRYYSSRLSKTELMKKKLCCLALTLCSGITLICAGLLDTSGSRIAYVALPYVSLFLPTAFCLTGSVRFSMGGRRLEFAAYDKSINRIHRSAIGQIMIGSIAAAGDIFYLLYNKKMEKPLAEFVFLGSMFIMMILGILTLRILKVKPYEAEELKKDDTEM